MSFHSTCQSPASLRCSSIHQWLSHNLMPLLPLVPPSLHFSILCLLINRGHLKFYLLQKIVAWRTSLSYSSVILSKSNPEWLLSEKLQSNTLKWFFWHPITYAHILWVTECSESKLWNKASDGFGRMKSKAEVGWKEEIKYEWGVLLWIIKLKC